MTDTHTDRKTDIRTCWAASSQLKKRETQLTNKIRHNSEEELLEKVRAVSEDYLYDTVEFNEFLQLMSKQQETAWTQEDLIASFK